MPVDQRCVFKQCRTSGLLLNHSTVRDYYMGQADLITHNKYFLMSPRYERAGTVGFRCAADMATSPYKGTHTANVAATATYTKSSYE